MILVPSATSLGDTLLVFPGSPTSTSRFVIIDSRDPRPYVKRYEQSIVECAEQIARLHPSSIIGYSFAASGPLAQHGKGLDHGKTHRPVARGAGILGPG